MRALLLSDIHANLVALEAVLVGAGPVGAVWSLGDAVGYGPRPNECAAWLAAHATVAVVGNHDLASIGRLESDDFNDVARAANAWTARQLSNQTRVWLATLPERRVDGDYTFVHGSPREPIWEYLLDEDAAAGNFAYFQTRTCFIGHSHLPLLFIDVPDRSGTGPRAGANGTALDLTVGRCIVNPGSVGQPRDGDPRAAYAIVDTDTHVVEFRRCEYDIQETQRQMQAARLPPSLIERLAFGL